MDLKVAGLQFDIAWERTQINLDYLSGKLKDLEAGVDVLILPEMFHCGFTMAPAKVAQVDGGEVLEWMKQTAAEYDMAIIGSVVVKTKDAFVNRLYVVNEGGVSWYDKRHLFTMGGEHLHYQQGYSRLTVDIKGWRFCPLICYDLRFPVWSRNMGSDYDVLVYVANWPASRQAVWEALLPARAIENQSYVIGVNRVGHDDGLDYSGGSQVVDARGKVVVNNLDEVGFFYINLSRKELSAFREKFPVLKDADNFELLF